jgi:hypothetical protein
MWEIVLFYAVSDNGVEADRLTDVLKLTKVRFGLYSEQRDFSGMHYC